MKTLGKSAIVTAALLALAVGARAQEPAVAQPRCNTPSLYLSQENANLVRFNTGFRMGPSSLVNLNVAELSLNNVACKGVTVSGSAWNYVNKAIGETETDLTAKVSFPIKKATASVFFDNWGYWKLFEDDNQSVGAALEHPSLFGTTGRVQYRMLNMKHAPNGHNLEYVLSKQQNLPAIAGREATLAHSAMIVGYKNYFDATAYPGYTEVRSRLQLRDGNRSFWVQGGVGYKIDQPVPLRWVPAVSAGVDIVLKK